MEEKAINPPAGVVKEVQKKVKNKELNTLKLIDLKKISRQIGIKGVSNLKKDSLIDLIKRTVSDKINVKKSPAKKSPAKKSPAKKSPAKKSPAKKTLENKNIDKKKFTEDYLSKYKRLGIEKINTKLEEVIESSNWIQKNREIQHLIKLFKEKFNREFKKAEKKFFIDNPRDKNFIYKPIFKTTFNKIISEYRDKRNKYFKDLDNIQNKNFEKKLEIIQNIKKLIDNNTDNFEGKYKEFKKNKENWHLTGPVPRSKDQNLWQTFRHHVERFYDLLHLNRKLREIDFKHNFEEKLKIIESAELLAKENDVIKATRNINILHKRWKNELGPVAKKHRESLWKRFQFATKEIQKNRKEFQKNANKSINKNITIREEILNKMKSCIEKLPSNHLTWQKKLIDFNKLREEFKNVGYIPNKDGKLLWKKFRDYSKLFMTSKNEFYKNQKVDYKNKISQKKDLIDELKSHLKSDDWDKKIEIIKKNQVRWKSIGFIPRKIDDKLWKEFSNLNALYFERIKTGYDKLDKNQADSYNLKKKLLSELNTLKLPKEVTKALKNIEKKIINWNKIGELNIKINKKLNDEFSKSLINNIKSNKSIIEIQENLIFEVKLKLIEFKIKTVDYIYESELVKEKKLINELNQLENNLDFFTNSSAKNPLFKDVENKILNIKNEIKIIKENKKRIKALIKDNKGTEGNEETKGNEK